MILTRQQRFIRNAKDSPYRRNGDDLRRGTYPTHYQMNQFEKYGVSYDVDPALRDVVIELNMRGYRTAGSCQGHDMRNHAFVSINSSKKEIPPEQATLSKREIYSMKNINVNEIKNIFKRHGIIITKYTPPSYNKRRIRDYHTFQFPAILDKAPPPDIIYWYKSSNGTLVYTDNKRDIPKQTRYLQMILTLETNLEHYKITDNGKIIWDKRVTAFNVTPCDKANVSIEIQRVVHKALGIPYNDKKILRQFTDSDELKKCKIKKVKS
jgi:hypothetical protein